VNWTKPACANKQIIIRNDEEIISACLAADAKSGQRRSDRIVVNCLQIFREMA
jgi:hypothetical protein